MRGMLECAGVCLGLVCLAAPVRGETFYLECERFENLGGWEVQSQYYDQLKSSYLIAHGLGTAVADASTTVEVKAAGDYNVWVRTKNWTARWRPDVSGAGRFCLIVNGRSVPGIVGARGGEGWTWVRLEAVRLERGRNVIALHDMTGYDGRADAICLSTEAKRPPRPKPTPVSDARVVNVDFVVCGGGIAGVCAAVTAARLGLKVALVQDRPVLGGNNSSEVRVHLGGYANIPPYPRLGDVLAEIAPAKGGNAEPAANYEDERKMSVVRAEKNLSLFLNTRIVSAETTNGERGGARRIAEAVGVDMVTGAPVRFVAPIFADCTGDAALGALVGAAFRTGREGKDEYGEPSAPEKADKMTMGASVQWRACKAPDIFAVPEEPWMIPFDEKSCHAVLKGDWDWETGMELDAIDEAEAIRDYGMLVAYSNWAYVKNHGKSRATLGKNRLEWVSLVAGKRESRRLTGDFVLTQNHLRKREAQPDGTCATTWTIDLHTPKTQEETHFAGMPFLANSANEKIWPYAIPFRCFYSKNVDNLLMAGRNISVTHIALGTTRLMRTCGMMGEVVGMAARVCRTHACLPRGVYAKYFGDLKTLMEKGAGRDIRNPIQDYNQQQSLDANLMRDYREAVFNRTTGNATLQDHLNHARAIRIAGLKAGLADTPAVEKACDYLESTIAEADKLGLSPKDVLKLYLKGIGYAHWCYLDDRLERYYDAIQKLQPGYTGDLTFRARIRTHYNTVKDARRFPLSEKEIGFGKTLKDFGIAERKTVALKEFWNPTNVTAALQKLVDDSEVTTIVLDKMPSPWYIGSVSIGKNVTGKRILLRSGCRVMRDPACLQPRTVKGPGAMFSIHSAEAVIIESDAAKPEDAFIGFYENYQARVARNHREGSNGILISHDVNERPTRNIIVRNVRIADCECDGIAMSNTWDPCENVYVENVILDSNYRQACSPVTYYSVYFKNVRFRNTRGGPPGCGIDVEPWDTALATSNLYFFDCTFENNAGGGMLILSTPQAPFLIYAKRCRFAPTAGAQVIVSSVASGFVTAGARPQSNFLFEDCTFESRGETLQLKPCPIYDMTFRNCVIRDARSASRKATDRKAPSPIGISLSRDLGTNDLPERLRAKIRFENVRVEGFEGAEAVSMTDELGLLNLTGLFEGALDWDGRKVDLSSYAYAGPDVNEPRTTPVPASKLYKPTVLPTADVVRPASNAKLSVAGAWWSKQPLYTYYFWAEAGRTFSFDFTVAYPDSMKDVPPKPVNLTTPTGRSVKIADVVKGTVRLDYKATESGWHRFTPGLTLDLDSKMESDIVLTVANVKGASVAYQADTVSDSFVKIELVNRAKPYTGYFEVPAGGKPCRIRVNYGGLVIRDPAGNVIEDLDARRYKGRHVFELKPSSDKAEIWSFTVPTGLRGGTVSVLRFYAPLNGIWADSPESLPCLFDRHHVPPRCEVAAETNVCVRLDASLLTAEAVKVLAAAKMARTEFAKKRAFAVLEKSFAEQIAKQAEDTGSVEDVRRAMADMDGQRKLYARAAEMEVKAAEETPEVFAVAAFCQAMLPTLALEPSDVQAFVSWKAGLLRLEDHPSLARQMASPYLDGLIADQLRTYDLSCPEGVLEYDDVAKLKPLLEGILAQLNGK